MNDRELLELAALAAGFTEFCWNEPVYEFGYEAGGGKKIKEGGIWDYKTGSPLWNPLTDDGDALRLAVKLNLMVITPLVDTACCSAHQLQGGQRISSIVGDGDHYAATRRAITTAAAEIGKAMKGAQ